MEFGERFSVLQKLGQGGMGIVYRVFDHSRSVEVALKALHLDQSHRQAQTRFKREFRAAARLDHPACVPVFDMGSIGELSYFTMEYARGGSLAHAGELSARQIAGVALQILAALDHIHSKQIVHRDIKPHNVVTLELALRGDLEQAVERGRLAAEEVARRDLRYPYLFVDGPFLAAAALLRARVGKLRSDVLAVVRRVRWLRRGAARAMRATLPIYLAGNAAWDIACGQRARGIRVLAQAARIAEAHGLRSCLLDVHAVGAAILTSDEPAGRWHTRGRDELTLAFAESRSLQPAPQAAQKMAS